MRRVAMTDRPIGGEMEILPVHLGGMGAGSPWPHWGKSAVMRCDTGRSALRCAVRDWRQRGGGSRIWLPHYLCESVRQAAAAEALTICYYDDMPGRPSSAFTPPEPQPDDLVLIVHYFGTVNDGALAWIGKSAGRSWSILEDCVQAPYSTGVGVVGDYVIASLRKWWPVPDGAILAANAPLATGSLQPPDENFVSQRAAGQLLRGARQDEARFLEWIEQSELRLDTSPPRQCSWLSKELLHSARVDEALERRRQNWLHLHELLASRSAQLDWLDPLHACLRPGEYPLTYAVRARSGKRDALRARLRQRKIFCPVHWLLPPSAPESARALAQEILSVPIDQRYQEADMLRVLEAFCDY